MSWSVIRHLPLAICSSLFLTLSFPPFDLGWLGWVAFVPWLVSLDQKTPRQAFWLSYAVGLLFFAGTMEWILYVTVPGFILLVAYLAFYFGVWGWLVQKTVASCESRVSSLKAFSQSAIRNSQLLFLPAAWVALEHLRCHGLTGLGWNLLAHTQWNWIPVIQMADVTGVTGVSFLIVLVNVAVWQWLRPSATVRRRLLGTTFLAGTCLFAAVAYGHIRLQRFPAPDLQPPSPSFKVAVVQGNIPQYKKWNETFQEAIWDRYEWLTHEAAKRTPDLILWPETAVPGYWGDPAISGRLQKLIKEVRTPLLVGAPIAETVPGTESVFNSAVLFNPDGTAFERYDKVHLVPFGEYLPLTPILEWLRNFVLMGNFSPGKRLTVFQSKIPFSVLICFEDLFPDLCRRFIRQGARMLVVITNDAWFIHSAASLQHAQASVFRAVEGRVWVARAANTGWSGFIDPAGRRLAAPGQIPRFEPGIAVAKLSASSSLSGYVQWGDWFPILCLIISVPGTILRFGTRYRLIRKKGYNRPL